MSMSASSSMNHQLAAATTPSHESNGSSSSSSYSSSLQEYLKRIPKVELHAHLNGCIREETLFELAAQRNVKLSDHHFHTTTTTTTTSSSSSCNSGFLYNVMPRSLQDCFDMFGEIPFAVNDIPALQRITHEALHDFAYNGSCAYLELRSTPKRLLLQDNDCSSSSRNSPENGNSDIEEVFMDKRTYIETILQVMRDFEQEEKERYEQELAAAAATTTTTCATTTPIRLPMICRLIVAVDRSQSLQEATENIELAIEFCGNKNNNKQNNSSPTDARCFSPTPRVVGVDLGGNPTKQDFQIFAPLFSKARDAGLKVTLHCGEVPSGVTEDENGGETNEMDDDAKAITSQGTIARYNEAVAVLDFKPDRLGHAMLLPSDLQERIVQEKIPVETCPTSNVMTLELTKKAAACHGPCYDDANNNGGGGEENGSHDNHDQGNLVAGLRHHPTLKRWLQQDHPLCISTDDPGVFRTSLTQELLLVAKTFYIPKERLAQRVVDGMQYAFCDNDTKSRIQKHMQEQLNQLNSQQQPQI